MSKTVEITISEPSPSVGSGSYVVKGVLNNTSGKDFGKLSLKYLKSPWNHENEVLFLSLKPGKTSFKMKVFMKGFRRGIGIGKDEGWHKFVLTDSDLSVVSKRNFKRSLYCIAREELNKFKVDLTRTKLQATTFNISLIGRTGSGKSSSINSFYTLMSKGQSVVLRAKKFGSSTSYGTSRSIDVYNFDEYNFKIFDVWGLDSRNWSAEELKMLFKGSLPSGWKQSLGVDGRNEKLKQFEDTAYVRKADICIFFIPYSEIDARNPSNPKEYIITDEYRISLKYYHWVCGLVNNPIVVITKADLASKRFSKNPLDVCDYLLKLKTRCAKLLSISESTIFFGKNYRYSRQKTKDFHIDFNNFEILHRALEEASVNRKASLLQNEVVFSHLELISKLIVVVEKKDRELRKKDDVIKSKGDDCHKKDDVIAFQDLELRKKDLELKKYKKLEMTDQKLQSYQVFLPTQPNYIGILGSGSYAVVSKMKIVVNGKDKVTAFKEMKDVLVKQKKVVDNDILEEARKLLMLNHRNIIKCYGYSLSHKGIFTEVCEISLETILIDSLTGGKKISLVQKIDFLKQISEGMRYLHEEGIVHRDLKLDNVLIVKNVCKIIDFGISKKIEGLKSTIMTTLNGSPIYVAPQVIDKTTKYNDLCDVFSFGVCCFSLFYEVVGLEDLGKMFYHGLNASVPIDQVKISKLLQDRNWEPKYPVLSNATNQEKKLVGLIKSCLKVFPYSRPPFKHICKILDDIIATKD